MDSDAADMVGENEEGEEGEEIHLDRLLHSHVKQSTGAVDPETVAVLEC